MQTDIIFNDAKRVLNKVDFRPLEGKTVLVTGATGLLGTHFLATLALLREQGMKVKTFGVYHSEPADYTKEIANRGYITLMSGDYRILDADVVLHLGGYAQPVRFTANPAETIRVNTTVTQRLLDCLRLDGKFLFVSSSEVYSGLSGYVNESQIGTTGPDHPRSGYIEGKRCGEAIVNAYRKAGVSAKSARLGWTYGPGTRNSDARAMSGIIRQALTENVIDLSYPGKEFRSFCYVSDAVEMLWNACLHGKEPVYNVSGPYVASIYEIAKEIAFQTGVTFYGPLEGDEMAGSAQVQMNIYKICREFRKVDYVGVQEGLANTIAWNRGLYV